MITNHLKINTNTNHDFLDFFDFLLSLLLPTFFPFLIVILFLMIPFLFENTFFCQKNEQINLRGNSAHNDTPQTTLINSM